MLGRKDHVGRTEQGIGSSGINTNDIIGWCGRKTALCATRKERIPILFARHVVDQREVNFSTFALADPVALHFLDRVRPIEIVKVSEQSLGVLGDAQHPLLEGQTNNRMAATF